MEVFLFSLVVFVLVFGYTVKGNWSKYSSSYRVYCLITIGPISMYLCQVSDNHFIAIRAGGGVVLRQTGMRKNTLKLSSQSVPSIILCAYIHIIKCVCFFEIAQISAGVQESILLVCEKNVSFFVSSSIKGLTSQCW